jgi:membrane dipeptidase
MRYETRAGFRVNSPSGLSGGRHNDPDTPITETVRHVDYLERIESTYVAFGSDFDGAVVPAELGGVAGLPKLVGALEEAGYDEAALAKITHGNWLRVLRETWTRE